MTSVMTIAHIVRLLMGKLLMIRMLSVSSASSWPISSSLNLLHGDMGKPEVRPLS